MSDSSEDEDLSRFRDAVDTTFTKLIDESRGKISTFQKQKLRSERYLDVATHYNDVKVPEEIQKRIGAKISDIIHRNIEFVEVADKTCFKKRKVKGGVKLFGDSVDFLSCEEDKDLLTCIHNKKSKEIKNANVRRKIDHVEELNEKDKISAVVVSGDTVLEGEKSWRSRRKQKIFEYKLIGKNKNKLIIEDKNS